MELGTTKGKVSLQVLNTNTIFTSTELLRKIALQRAA